jgi:hypothetical protein
LLRKQETGNRKSKSKSKSKCFGAKKNAKVAVAALAFLKCV